MSRISGNLNVDGNLNVWTSASITSSGLVSASDFRDYNYVGGRALVSDLTKNIVESSVTSAQINYLNTTSANIQTQFNNISALDSQKALKTTTITAGTMLSGGGALSTHRTISHQTVGTAGTYSNIVTNSTGHITSARNLIAGDMPAGIDASNIGSGNISNTEFSYLDGVSANIQTQLNGKLISTDVRQIYNWYFSRPTDCNLAPNGNGGIRSFVATSVMSANKPPQGDSSVIQLGWDTIAGWDSQIAIANTGQIQTRAQKAGTWGTWNTLWDSINLSNPINGTGISNQVAYWSSTSGMTSNQSFIFDPIYASLVLGSSATLGSSLVLRGKNGFNSIYFNSGNDDWRINGTLGSAGVFEIESYNSGSYIDTPISIGKSASMSIDITRNVNLPTARMGFFTIPSYPYTLTQGSYYYVKPKIDTDVGTVGRTINLPASPSVGCSFMIFGRNASSSSTAYVPVISGNGKTIVYTLSNSEAYSSGSTHDLTGNTIYTYDGTYWYAFCSGRYT